MNFYIKKTFSSCSSFIQKASTTLSSVSLQHTLLTFLSRRDDLPPLRQVKFSMELPGMVKQEPVDTSYDTSTDPHCVPSAVGCPQQAMQKVPDITDLSDPESSLGEYEHQHHFAARLPLCRPAVL